MAYKPGSRRVRISTGAPYRRRAKGNPWFELWAIPQTGGSARQGLIDQLAKEADHVEGIGDDEAVVHVKTSSKHGRFRVWVRRDLLPHYVVPKPRRWYIFLPKGMTEEEFERTLRGGIWLYGSVPDYVREEKPFDVYEAVPSADAYGARIIDGVVAGHFRGATVIWSLKVA